MLRGIVAGVTKGSENDESPRPGRKVEGCSPDGCYLKLMPSV